MKKANKSSDKNNIEFERDFAPMHQAILNIANKGMLKAVHFGKPKNGFVRVKFTIKHSEDDIAEQEVEKFRILIKEWNRAVHSSKADLRQKGGQ